MLPDGRDSARPPDMEGSGLVVLRRRRVCCRLCGSDKLCSAEAHAHEGPSSVSERMLR